MPIKTDLSASPHFSDFDEVKKYHKVLFKPSVAVQTRELNNMQQMLQHQIEVFGNNIFKRGTIIDGCNFIFYDNYPYVKIRDSLVDGSSALPSEYVGYFVKNSNNLRAKIVNYYDGFETSDPDLKTLYISYINSGNNFTMNSFSSGEILTLFDSRNSIHSISVDDSGTAYSNSDTIVITPQLVVNVVSGSFDVGDTITDPASGANGVITAVETLVERRPVVKLAGTIDVAASNTELVGTSTTFTDDFSNGDYIALYSNSTTYAVHKINVVTSNTVMNVTSNVTFTNTAVVYANTTSSEIFLQYSPLPGDLANASSTANNWTFTVGNTVQGSTSSNIAKIIGKVGENASAFPVTDSTGTIDSVTVSNRGINYAKTPHVSIKSATGTSAVLTGKNYLGQVTVSSTSGSVGSGYAFGVTRGHIFQKGHFILVEPQTVVVEKYSRSPNNVSVAFETWEEIINSNIDTNLVDNALGSPNYTAPGADRLKLTANLITYTTSNSTIDGNEMSLVDWSDGIPYKQNRLTEYNTIQDSISRQIYETDGNYIVDRFLVTSTSPSNSSLEGNTYNIVVDPGTAYVQGKRVQTLGNYVYSGSKIDANTRLYENSKLSLNYDGYVRVNEVGGFFEFDQANEVDLYDTAKNFLSTDGLITAGNTEPVGSQIGTAKIRNFVHEQGTPGSPNAVYRMYLFDIKMYAGKNFKNVKSIHYDSGTDDGIADTYLENDPTTNTNISVLYNKNDKLVFKTNYASIKNANNINYQYRTTETVSIANTGQVVKSLVSIGKNFPYTGTLTDSQKSEIYLTPKANLVSFDDMTGTVTIDSSNTNVAGSGTLFLTEIKVGDYIQLDDTVTTDIKRVESVVNNTFLTLDNNPSFTNSSVVATKAWPMNVPIELAYNTNYTANVNGTSEVLTIDLLASSSNGFNTASNTDVYVSYNVEANNASVTAKTPKRDVYVKLQLSNNEATSVGPWCLGITDIFRLKGVWKGSSNAVSESDTNVTNEFYIDHNQMSNYYGLGYLYQRRGSALKLTDDDFLLVKFDRLNTSAGFYMATSYVSSNTTTRAAEDAKELADLTTTMNTLEIPEFVDEKGNYFDLINCVDFRPRVSDTANGNAITTASATLNPNSTVAFSATDRYFPVPDSVFRYNAETYTAEYAVVSVDKTGKINVSKTASPTDISKNVGQNEVIVNVVRVPAYPSVPYNKSQKLVDILDRKIYNENKITNRIQRQQIDNILSEIDVDINQPKNYKQADIGSIDRRLKAVEYYISFNNLQNDVKNLNIPSSISPTINRFKYGFFVDDYNTSRYTEYRSPEYFAQIVDSYVEPQSVNLNLVHANNNLSSTDYEDYEILKQPLATKDTSDRCSCNTTTTSTNAVMYKLYAKQDNTVRYSESDPYEEPARYVTMGSTSSNATLWFHAYGGKDQVYVYQGNTLITSGDDAIALTSDEVIELKKDSFFNGSPDGHTIAVSTNGSAPGNNYVQNTGKISWTHNPSLGRTYKIVVKKSSVTWRYRMDFYNAEGGEVCFCDPTNPPPSLFDGVMTVEPAYFDGADIRYTARFSAGDDAGKAAGAGGDAAGTSGGGGGAGGSGGKIVCTAMNESYGFGSFRNNIWLKQSATLTKEHEVGYHAIFMPLVKYGFKSDRFGSNAVRRTLEWIARHRTSDIWYQMKGSEKRDFWGMIIRPPLETLCYAVGYIKTRTKGKM